MPITITERITLSQCSIPRRASSIAAATAIVMAIVKVMANRGKISYSNNLQGTGNRSFQNLKDAFTYALVLAYYNYSKYIVIKTDALTWALEGVLS